jgi:hypothetical protein
MNRLIAYILFVLLIWMIASCSPNHNNTELDHYNNDSLNCQKSDIDYHDCMRERGWMNDDHWRGVPEGNPYQNQIPRK